MIKLQKTSLSQQVALIVVSLCLLVSLTLVILTAISSRFLQDERRAEYGDALAHLIAQRVSTAMESGDLLGAAASLQRFVDTSAAETISLTDIEGKTIGQAGHALGKHLYHYAAPVRIESDVAGNVTVGVSDDRAESALREFILGLLGLALVLSIAAYIGTRLLTQGYANRLLALARSLRLQEEAPVTTTRNELAIVEQRVNELPMDLLRTRAEPAPSQENYVITAVLYLNLGIFEEHVETLDEHTQLRYINRMHQLAFAAAGFYAGDLQVCRQFGLAIYFTGTNNAGSAAFRAACCAWLIRQASEALEGQLGVSLRTEMAIAQSELGIGNGSDIYPGLYMQSTLDELQTVCTTRPEPVLLSPTVKDDVDLAGRLQTRPSPQEGYLAMDTFQSPYNDLLERQLRLMLNRLNDPGVFY